MNTSFFVYNTSTGEILWNGTCQVDDVQLQEFTSNTAAMAGEADPHRQYIDITSGELFEYDETVRQKRITKPRYKCSWDMELFDWVDDRELEEIKANKLNELAAKCQEEMYSSIEYMGHTFQADQESVRRLNGVLTASAFVDLPEGFGWLSQENVLVPMTKQELGGLAAAMVAHGWQIFQFQQTLKAQVIAAEIISQVKAIVW